MAILAWGKPTIQFATSQAGAPIGAWNDIDTPKQDTTKLTPTAGAEVTATEEGGEVVDSRTSKNSYSLEFDLFVKKGVNRPFDDNDGVIPGEFSFRIIPEDEGTEGIQIDRCTLRAEESYTAADGKMLHYVAKCLKPATGKIVKPYIANSLVLDKTKLYFGSSADTTGKVVTATSTGNVSSSTDASWILPISTGKTTTIKVSVNNTNNLRVALVTITADGKTGQVEVSQIPA